MDRIEAPVATCCATRDSASCCKKAVGANVMVNQTLSERIFRIAIHPCCACVYDSPTEHAMRQKPNAEPNQGGPTEREGSPHCQASRDQTHQRHRQSAKNRRRSVQTPALIVKKWKPEQLP